MKRYLIFISLSVILGGLRAQALYYTTDVPTSYAVNIDFAQVNFSGICIIRDIGTGVTGSLINEFGLKAFDFVFDKEKGKCKITNAFHLMNKWYIRKVIGADLSILLRAKNTKRKMRKHRIEITSDYVILQNIKFKLRYKFKPLHEID